MKQEIEKIVEALKAAEMRQGCTDYHVYAEKLYEDLFPKPSTANREAEATKYIISLFDWHRSNDLGPLSVEHRSVKDCAKNILALWPKVLSDEELLQANSSYEWTTEDNYQVVDEARNLGRWRAISQATVGNKYSRKKD